MRRRRVLARMALAASATVVVAGCVGSIEDPVGDGGGGIDIVKATLDYRRTETHFILEVTPDTAVPVEDLDQRWCLGPDLSRCGSTDAFVVVDGDTYQVFPAQNCFGALTVHFDGETTYSFSLDTRCLLPNSAPPDSFPASVRFRAFASSAQPVFDETGISEPVFISD